MDGRIPGVWRWKRCRRSEDARPPSSVLIDLSSRLKFFFFSSKRYLLRKLFHFEEEIVDERKEKFVVYGAVGIDDAGSFFFTTRPAIGIGIHLEGPS